MFHEREVRQQGRQPLQAKADPTSTGGETEGAGASLADRLDGQRPTAESSAPLMSHWIEAGQSGQGDASSGGQGPRAASAAAPRMPALSDQSGSGSSSSTSAGGKSEGAVVPFSAVVQAADAPEGGAEKPAGGEQGAAQAGGDLHVPQLEGEPAVMSSGGNADAIVSSLSHKPTTSRGGVTLGAGDFGLTVASLYRFSNVVIKNVGKTFAVTADLKEDVNWDTRGGTGPDGQVEIAGDSSAAITRTNYPQVVADLTPDSSDLNGRPPREQFWSKDLTERHEKFHAKDNVDIIKSGVGKAGTVLAGKTASSAADVTTHLNDVWNSQVVSFWQGQMALPGSEERAYGDGKAAYAARAKAIETKGKAGKYP
jgi:hypothetical protein